jgi:RNA polymerase sigma-70 factor (ECF subfamily)
LVTELEKEIVGLLKKGDKRAISIIYENYSSALYFEGMSQQEASDELNIPLGTIKSRLKIGLRELKKVYNP